MILASFPRACRAFYDVRPHQARALTATAADHGKLAELARQEASRPFVDFEHAGSGFGRPVAGIGQIAGRNSATPEFREPFEQALLGSAAPALPDVGPCAWAWDWQQWVMGSWHRDSRAEGLQP